MSIEKEYNEFVNEYQNAIWILIGNDENEEFTRKIHEKSLSLLNSIREMQKKCYSIEAEEMKNSIKKILRWYNLTPVRPHLRSMPKY